ncbi:MAG: T9SS type A sorting domain-containing protein [Bacteroidetes bacterium]|nr:T9SS type A sorting domain-containing protein [Bacteroidota bacterium]
MRKIFTFLLFMFLTTILFSQDWLTNLPENKTKEELTLFDYQNAFYTYWEPFKVENGYYVKDGVKLKANGWKQFKRWEYDMESQINKKTGEFPKKTAQECFNEYLKSKSKQNTTTTANWSSLGPNNTTGGYAGIGRINCIAFHPTDNNTYWVGAASGGLWVTINNGMSWTCLTDTNGILAISDIAIPSDYAVSNTIYIATGDRDHYDNRSIGVLKSTNNGISWNTTGLSYSISSVQMVNRMFIDPGNNQTLIAATNNGVFKSTNGGLTWNTQLTNLSFIDMEYKPGDFNTLYGSTKTGTIHISTDGGITWSTAYTDANAKRIELAVSANQPTWVYAVAASSNSGLYAILKSTSSGASYSQVFSGTSANLLGSYSDGSSTGGNAWYDLCIAVSPLNANILLVGGINTHKSVNGGLSWTCSNCWVSSPPQNSNNYPAVHADKHSLIFRNNGDLFEGNDGGIYISTNIGSTWTNKTNGIIISQMYKLSVSQTQSNMILTGLQDNGTKLLSSGNWSDVFGGDGTECLIDYSNTNTQYGSYQNGKIFRTTDFWNSTTLISANIPFTLNAAWVTPFIIDPINNQTLYAGYSNIWKTNDKGDTWTQMSSNINTIILSMAISPSNTQVLYVSSSYNIWKTVNGGTLWTDITGTLPLSTNSITSIAIKNDDENTLWVTLSGYNANKVYQSVNGGNTWTDISSGLPQIPAFSIVQNKQFTSEVHLYVGTEIGVYFKKGNADWILYNNGLPNVKIGEIEIYYNTNNPQNSLLRAATYGRGLWETPVYFQVCTPPTSQATTFSTSSITQNSMKLSWTRGNGDSILVIAKAGSMVNFTPVNGNYYTSNSVFGNGPQIGNANYVIYKGSGGSVNISGLTASTNYYFSLYEYSATDFCYKTPALNGNALTLNVGIEENNTMYQIKVFPNPFNKTTTISYFLTKPEKTELTIIDITGKVISTLVSELQDKGLHKIELQSEKLTKGIYFYKLNIGDFNKIGKLILY